MSTATQGWVRAELSGSTGGAFGAQLMIPADSLEFHGDDLVFQARGEVVYVAEPGQLRSITWLAKAPNPELERRKAMWPKHGTRWTDDERAELLQNLLDGVAWSEISKVHGRSRSGVQQEAVKQGWVDDVRFELFEEYQPGDPAAPVAPPHPGESAGSAESARSAADPDQDRDHDRDPGPRGDWEPAPVDVTDEARGGT